MAGNEFFYASPFSLENFAIAANIAEVRSYWTGSAWDDDFANAATYSLTADTQDGEDGFTGSITPSITDPLTLTILCWETGITPALGTQATSFDLLWTGTEIGATLGNSVSITIETNSVQSVDLNMLRGEQRSFVFTLTDSDGNATDITGHSPVFKISDLDFASVADIPCTIQGAENNEVVCTVDTDTSSEAETYRYVLMDDTTHGALAKGGFEVLPAYT